MPKAIPNTQRTKTHYWTFHCTPEREDTASPTRAQTQVSQKIKS